MQLCFSSSLIHGLLLRYWDTFIFTINILFFSIKIYVNEDVYSVYYMNAHEQRDILLLKVTRPREK